MSTQETSGAKPASPTRKAPPVLFEKTQSIIADIERALDEPVVTYWNSTNGSICSNDVIGLYGVLQNVGKVDRLSFFIKSGGGFGEASLRMVNLLRQYAGRLSALVPLECSSAATMLALGADEIKMGPLAQLSAVDTSLTHALSPVDRNNHAVSVSQDELDRVLRLWKKSRDGGEANPYPSLYQQIHPLVFGAIDRASSLSIKICEEILSYHVSSTKDRQRISKHLNSAYPSHGYPIMLREAKRIGLKVGALDPSLNDLLIDLNELYSEMGQQAITDYDQENYHDHEILNIIEGKAVSFLYQNDKDWHYRKEERRWVPMNDQSAWQRVGMSNGKLQTSKFHIR